MSLLLAAGGVSRSLICAAGAYTYSGKNATLGVGLTASSGVYSYSGVAATLGIGLTASAGAYSYTGIAATLLKIAGNNSGGGSNKKKRKKLPYRLQAQYVFGDRKSTRLNSSHLRLSRMPSSA